MAHMDNLGDSLSVSDFPMQSHTLRHALKCVRLLNTGGYMSTMRCAVVFISL